MYLSMLTRGIKLTTIIMLLLLIPSIVIHEVAHGWAAYKLGDPTAKLEGRLTLNPFAHMDIVGSLLIPGMLILSQAPFVMGWAKPVPVNPYAFQNPEKDMLKVALAGPLSNFSMAFVAKILMLATHTSSLSFLTPYLTYFIVINVLLGLFNLLPIPPLDGSKVMYPFLSSSLKTIYYKIEPYGFLILFGLFYFNILDGVISLLFFPIVRVFLA